MRTEFLFSEKCMKWYPAISRQIELFMNDTCGGEKNKIAIYPCGQAGEFTRDILEDRGFKVSYLFDKEKSQRSELYLDIDSFSPEDMKDTILFICSDNVENFGEIRQSAYRLFSEDKIYDICMKVCTQNDVRWEALRLNAERINRLKLDGCVAEAGVYRGKFAKQINKYFPNRKMYLFDTFEGFINNALARDCDEHWMNVMKTEKFYFDEVNFDTLLNEFKYPDKCIIKKGYFPDTTDGITDTFCFVSLDLDTYTGIKDGLQFFYDRMVTGGVIFIHDYNNYSCKGVRKAVEEFVQEKAIPVVLLPDEAGTCIVAKV